jgi:hypothetical protein
VDLDEEATVDAWCVSPAPVVLFRPRLEKRRTLCLVIDASASTDVWAEVADAWKRVVVGSGVFRSVRVLRLDADSPRPTLGPWSGRLPRPRGVAAQAPPPCGADSLLLVLSDCCSRAWWSGEAFRLFAGWGRRITVGLVGLLPEPFWPRTALGRHRFVRLYRPAGGGPLYTLGLPGLDEEGDVLTAASLDERSFRTLPPLLGVNPRAATGGGCWWPPETGSQPTPPHRRT